MKYLKSKGAIVNGKTIGGAITALDNIMKNKKLRDSMVLKAKKLYKHNATDEIVKFLYHNRQLESNKE